MPLPTGADRFFEGDIFISLSDERSIMNGSMVVMRPSVPTLKAAMKVAVSQDLR